MFNKNELKKSTANPTFDDLLNSLFRWGLIGLLKIPNVYIVYLTLRLRYNILLFWILISIMVLRFD